MKKPAPSHVRLAPPDYHKPQTPISAIAAPSSPGRSADAHSAFGGRSVNVVGALSTLPTSSRRFGVSDARSALRQRSRRSVGAADVQSAIRRFRRPVDARPTLSALGRRCRRSAGVVDAQRRDAVGDFDFGDEEADSPLSTKQHTTGCSEMWGYLGEVSAGFLISIKGRLPGSRQCFFSSWGLEWPMPNSAT